MGYTSALHAYVLLKADEGWQDEKIAEAYPVSLSTIARIRQRFVEEGLKAALGRKPSNRVYRKKIEEEGKPIWCIPPEQNAAFVCQMEEILSLYAQPYDSQLPESA